MPDRTASRRILIVDDNPAIHDDLRRILAPPALDAGFVELDRMFGSAPADGGVAYYIDSSYQGQEALTLVERSCAEGRPYALAIVDMRMPPGWDGVETIEHLQKVDPNLQYVICTAYSDRSWDDVVRRVRGRDRLLILKKPFDAIEVKQMADALSEKWILENGIREQLAELTRSVEERTDDLAAARERAVRDREVLRDLGARLRAAVAAMQGPPPAGDPAHLAAVAAAVADALAGAGD